MYHTEEGSFEISESFHDRTVNCFVLGETGRSQFNLSISRDIPLQGEQVGDYVERQLKILKKNINKYKLIQKKESQLGGKYDGVEIYGTWKEKKQNIFQRQAAFLITQNKILIFSATSEKDFAEREFNYWQKWLNSFR